MSTFWNKQIVSLVVGAVPALFKFVRNLFSGGGTKEAAQEVGKELLEVAEPIVTEIVDETLRKNITRPRCATPGCGRPAVIDHQRCAQHEVAP